MNRRVKNDKRLTNYVRWLVNIDEATAAKIDLLLLDPRKARVRYGSRTELVNMLLKRFIEDVQAGHVAVPDFSEPDDEETPNNGGSNSPAVG